MQDYNGRLIKGYHVHEKLGEGGFGAVYRAEQTAVGRNVAIKIIHPRYANQPAFIRRFETEAQLIARLEHMHIVPLHDYWRDPEGAYLVMRMLKGGSLRGAIQRDGTFEPRSAAELLNQIASALEAAHARDIIHRDLKPENILLDEDGNAYLADFGIAKNLAAPSMQTQADEIVGSLDYISPEQARGEPVTARTDVYSLGVVLYEMLTGSHPWPNLSSVERLYKHINDPLPEIDELDGVDLDALHTVLQKATAKDPARRYASASEFAQAFQDDVVKLSSITGSLEAQLTRREQEVLRAIIAGKSNREIANEMFVEVSTVKWHVRQLYRKLGVRSRVQAIIRARELALIGEASQPEESSASAAALGTTGLPEPVNPYKGLQAFSAADVLDFFGREALVEKLVGRVAESRFVAVIGPSGSGKSSVVRAGLVPALWQGTLPGSEKWFVVDLLPGSRPLDQLEVALTRVAADQADNLHEHLQRDEGGLLRCADLILPDDGSQLVVVVDQFEEVFTLVEDEASRQHFLNLLVAAATDPHSRVKVVISLRADFYDRPLRYPAFGALLRAHMETVLPLTAEGLEGAIVKPAQRVGVSCEPGLVARIVTEMNYQAGALPLLQYALTELFDRREGRQMTLAAYEEIGGAVGALAKRAETTFKEMSVEAQAATRQMFLRLVTLGEGVEDTRRRTPRAELLQITPDPELMDDIIEAFAEYRLLSLDHDADTRTPTVEVAHEAILREWERLRRWLDESRADIRLERVLARNADEWAQHGRDESYLLTGARLEQVEQWHESATLAFTPVEHDFIVASIQKRAHDATAERARQAREIAQVRRSRTLLRVLVAVFALVAVGAVAFSIFAFDREQAAQNAEATSAYNAEASRALALVNAAQAAIVQGDRDAAIAFALEANRSPSATSQAGVVLAQAAYPPGARGFTPQNHAEWRVAAHPDGETLLFSTVAPGATFRGARLALETFEVVQIYGEDEALVGDAMAMSPDGRSVVYGDEAGTLIRFEVETGAVLSRYAGPGSGTIATTAAISPDGRLLAASYWDQVSPQRVEGGVRIWDLQSGDLLHSLEGHPSAAPNVVFSPDSRWLAAGGVVFGPNGPERGIISLWDSQTGECIHTLGETGQSHQLMVFDLVFTRDAGTLLSLGGDQQLIFWDMTTYEPFADVLATDADWFTMNALVLSPDEDLVLASAAGTIYGISTRTYERTLALEGHTGSVNRTLFVEDGQRVISFGLSNRVWDLSYGPEIASTQVQGAEWFHASYATTTDGALGMMLPFTFEPPPTGDAFEAVQPALTVFDLQTGDLLHQMPLTEEAYPYSLYYYQQDRASDDGHQLVTTSLANDEAILWDLDTGQEVRRYSLGMTGMWAVDADEHYVVFTRALEVAEYGDPLLVLDLNTGETRQFSGEDYRFNTGMLTRDHRTVLAPSTFEGVVVAWDFQTGERRYAMDTGLGFSQICGVSPDSRYFVTTGDNVPTQLRDIATGEVIYDLNAVSDFQFPCLFSPDSTAFATSDPNGTYLFDTSTGALLQQYEPAKPLVWLADDVLLVDYCMASNGEHFCAPHYARWRVDDREELLAWVTENRYARDFTCVERAQYRIEPLCE